MIVFICLEIMNVATLYFIPGSKKGNGIGVFNAWEKSKADEEVHQFIKYLIFWVAGTKLIFISLIIVIIILGSFKIQLAAAVVLVFSIATFFWRLFPIIRSMDLKKQISPQGYSKTLGVMIAVFMSMFICAIVAAVYLK